MTTETLSKPRLERLHHVLSGYIHRGDMPGLVALVSCHGRRHFLALKQPEICQSEVEIVIPVEGQFSLKKEEPYDTRSGRCGSNPPGSTASN